MELTGEHRIASLRNLDLHALSSACPSRVHTPGCVKRTPNLNFKLPVILVEKASQLKPSSARDFSTDIEPAVAHSLVTDRIQGGGADADLEMVADGAAKKLDRSDGRLCGTKIYDLNAKYFGNFQAQFNDNQPGKAG